MSEIRRRVTRLDEKKLKVMEFSNFWEVLSQEQVMQIHLSSLNVLERTGLRIYFDDVRFKQLASCGLDVSSDTGRVRFPSGIVEEALKKAPRSYTLCARDPRYDLILDGRRGYLGLDGSGTEIKDFNTGEVRPSVKRDLEEAVRAADALPQISYLWPCLSAQDYPAPSQPLHELEAMLLNSSKHAQAMTAVNKETALASVAMAAAVSPDALKDRPIISSFQCSTSPLSYDVAAMEAAFVYAEHGVPCGFLDMTIACATAPATLTGSLVQGNAEIIGAMVILQLLYPGAKTFYGSCATVMELNTGDVTCGGPQDVLLQAATAQMSRFYNLPSMAGTFATGAKASDWRCGAENALSCVISALAGTELMCGAGLLGGARIFSFEQLIKDCEIYDMNCRLTQGFKVDAENLAEDVINSVGPGGNYLTEEHTLKHMREQWQSSIKDERAALLKAKDILEGHKPLALENHDKIRDIIKNFELNLK